MHDGSAQGHEEAHHAHGAGGGGETGAEQRHASGDSAVPAHASTAGDGPAQDRAPDAGRAPAGAGSPEVAEAEQQITATAEKEAAQIEQVTQGQSEQLLKEAEDKAAQMKADGQQRAQALSVHLAEQTAQVRQRFVQATESIRTNTAQQLQAATEDQQRALASLKAEGARRQEAALAAAQKEAAAAQASGQRESGRAQQSTAATVSAVEQARAHAAAGYAGADPRVQSAVRDSMQGPASETSEGVRKRGADVGHGASDTMSRTAQAIRSAGQQLVAAMKPQSAETEKAIRQGADALRGQLQQMGQQAERKLSDLQTKTLQTFARASASAGPSIQRATAAAAEKLRQSAQTAVGALQSAAKATAAAMRSKGAEMAQGLQRIPASARRKPGSVREYVQGAQQALREAGQKAGQAQARHQTQSIAGMQQVLSGFGSKLGSRIQQLMGQIRESVAGLQVLSQISEEVRRKGTEARTQLRDGNEQAVRKFGQELQKPVDEGQRGWSQQRDKAEQPVKAKVDELIGKNAEVVAHAPSQFEDTARKAAAEANQGLLSRIWNGIVSGLKKFWDGMKWFLLAFLIVFAAVLAVLAFIVGGIELALIALAALIALTLVGIGFLIYGLISSLINRFSQLWHALDGLPLWAKILTVIVGAPWVAAVSVGDVFGVSPLLEGVIGFDLVTFRKLSVEERSERITIAVLTIATFLILRRVGKALGAEGGPTEEPQIKPGEEPVPDPAEKPAPSLSARLASIRQGLKDPRAIEEFDSIFERVKSDSAKMERIIEGIEKGLKDGQTLEERLIQDWQRNHPTPPDSATLGRVGELIERANRLKSEAEAFRDAHPEVKGVGDWIKALSGELRLLDRMRSDVKEVTPERLDGSRANLNGIEAEMNSAKANTDVTGVGAQKFLTADGREAQVDVVSDKGAKWTESKADEPFGLESNKWPEMKAQAERLLDAAKNNPKDGKPPSVTFRFENGVSSAVKAALRNMGVEVEGPVKDPPAPPPLAPPQPSRDHEPNK